MSPIACEPRCCPEAQDINIPGPEGEQGDPGTDGVSAFTTLTANLTLPAVNGSVAATVADNSWMVVGAVYVSGDGTDFGTFRLTTKTGSTGATFTFLGAPSDSAPAAVIASGSIVTAGGAPITTPITVPNGGTGLATLTDRSVVIGRAAANVEFATPGNAGQVLLSTGAASNPAFGAVDLADADAVTGVLPAANGGTGGVLPVENGGTEVAALTDRSVIIGRATAAVEFAVPGADPQPLLSTGAATNPAFGALNVAGTNTVTGSLPIANGGTAGTTKATALSSLGLGQALVSEYSSGTAYNLTNSAAVVVFGTSGNMEVVINAAGLWHLYYFLRVDYVGATFAAEQTVSMKLRRSNNTPGDVASSAHAFMTAIITTLDHTAMLASYGPIAYATVNTTDNIQVQASIDISPSAGTIEVVEAYLVAVPIALS